MTQDIGTTIHKHEDYKTDLQFFVVGDEQNFHFNVLFTILKRLGYNFAEGCHHYSYGMINLPEGKMKSREGTVVDADELIVSLQNMVKDIMAGRDLEKDLDERSLKLALAALKFMILKINPVSTMIFNPKEAISFEGDTGPYLLYVYVRCQHILAKAGTVNFEGINYGRLGNEEEIALVKHLIYFPDLCITVATDYNLSVLASYLLNLGKKFHRFYHLHDVLHQDDAELMRARLAIIKCVRDVIYKGLKLLFIDVVEEM
jgi:arginyl-tRNA synthetase